MLHVCVQQNLCSKEDPMTPYYLSTTSRYEQILKNFFELVASVDTQATRFDKNHLPKLFVCFTKYYKREDLPLDKPEPIFQLRRKGKTPRKASAIVMDPCNPTNNLWLTLGDPSLLAKRAQKALHTMF